MTLLARFLLLGFLSLIPALAIQGYQMVELRRASQRATHEDVLRTLALVEGQLNRTVEGVRQTLTVLSDTMAVRQRDGPACQALLRRLSGNVVAPGVAPDSINVTDRTGVVWCSSQAVVKGLNLADRPYVRDAMATGGFVIGGYIARRSNQRSALPFAVAYRTVDGAIGGAVAAIFEAETIGKVLPAAALPPGSVVTLADRDGVVLFSEPPLRRSGQRLDETQRAVLDAPHRGIIAVHDADGIDRLVAYAPVGAYSPAGEEVPRLFLSVGLDRGTMLADAHRAALDGLGLLAFNVAAALALATLPYRRMIHRPLASIRATVQRWREGDYVARPTGARCREFRDLFNALAEMAKAVAGRDEDQRARLEAERAANQAREMLSIALQASDAGWWVWDVEHDVVTMSEENARLLGRDSADRVHTLADWLATVHPDDRDQVKAARQHMHRIEYRVHLPDDEVRWLISLGKTTFDEHGQAARSVGINMDITAQKRAEADLIAAKRQAEQANRYKTSFLAAASHDLRQPVQSLMLFSSCLAGRIREPKEQSIISHIDGSIQSLKALLDGLLDISRLEAGKISPQVTEVALRPLLAQIASEYEPQARHKGLRLRVVSTSMWARTDPALLDRIVRNLVENAIKYTQAGGIVVGCRHRRDKISIEVLDTGIGIPKEQMKLVFEEFHQIDNPERNTAKGLGLGLAIVRRLSQLMGSRVEIQSEVGRGTRFTVAIPWAAAQGTALSEAVADQGRDGLPGCVVLIEDEQAVREGLEDQLADWGVDVLAGPDDGAVATRLDGRRPDLIIADYRLKGGLTGVQAIHRLAGVIGAEIPSMLLTGETDPRRLEEMKASGLAILHKPVQPSDLRRELSRVVRASSGNGPSGVCAG